MSASDNLWIIGGEDNTKGTIKTSTNGITWSGAIKIFNNRCYAIEHANGLFVALGDGGGGIMTSTDATTWTASNYIFVEGRGVACNNGFWVAVGYNSNTIATSENGTTWTGKGNSIFTSYGLGVAYGNNLWVAVGIGGNTMATSTDGVTWTGRGSSVFPYIGLGVAYANNLWVAVGSTSNSSYSGNFIIATSTDGINWTQRGSFSHNGGNRGGVVYGNGLWIVYGNNTSNIFTSPDGITWTVRATGFQDAVRGLAYYNNMWVAGAFGTPTNAYSSNGTTWTSLGNQFIYSGWAVAGPNLPTTLSNFTVASRAIGSGNFTITPPTTNSNGTFTYTSSNTAVATITGNTVTMVGKGTTTITATQNNTKQFQTGTISTVFGVYVTGSYTANNVNYTYYDGLGTATVTTSGSATGDINLLSTFDINGTTYTVTSIAASAFSSRPITSVTIPNTVTSIGASAFWTTNIASVTIPASVTSIGTNAFGNCVNLATIVVNAYISNLSSAFTYMNASLPETWTFDYVGAVPDSICAAKLLSSVTISNLITGIGAGAFNGCTGLTSITLPSTITSIGQDAFRDCTWLTSITIPNAVTTFGQRTFMGCTGLTSFSFPSSLVTAGDSMFIGCTNLTNFSINSNVTNIGAAFVSFTTPNTTLTFNYVGSIPGIAFQNATFIKTVVIGNLVTSIGYGAFYMNSNLSSLTLGSSLTLIGQGAFNGCTKITSITLPSSLVTIEDNVFAGTQISTISFPSSLTSLGGNAFGGCTALTSVTIPPTLTTVGNVAFTGCTSLTTIVIQAYMSGFAGSFPINNANMSITFDYANIIPNSACQNKTNLKTLIIGNSITAIGTSSFSGTGITSVTIPASVATVGNSAFASCGSLNNIVVRQNYSNYSSIFTSTNAANTSVTFDYAGAVPASACTNKTGITSLIMSNSINGIGTSAFSGCTGLTNIIIPASVTSIGASAFNACTNLNTVSFLGNIPIIGSSNFTSSTDTAFYQVDGTTNTNPTTLATNLSMFTTKTQIGLASPTISNFIVPSKRYLDPSFSLVDPSSNSSGLFVYTSSDTSVATVSGKVVTIISVGTTTITATQQSSYATGYNYTEGTITANLVVGKANPALGTLSIGNKTITDAPFTVVEPTKPANNTGTWSYASLDTTKATIDGNVVTLIGTGLVQISATISEDSLYNAKTIMCQFSVAEEGIAPSNFTYTQTSTVVNVIPSTVQPVAETVTLSSAIFTTAVVNQLNPTTGTNVEKEENRKLVSQILLSNFPTATKVVVPKNIMYLPPAIKQTGVNTITVLKTDTTTSSSPLVLSTSNVTQDTVFYSDLNNVGNSLLMNGTGSFSGYSLQITKDTGINYNIIRTNNENISTTSTSITGDVILYAGFKIVLGSVTGQLFDPTPVITNFSVATKIFGNPAFTLIDPSSNSDGAFSYTSSNTSVATISGNVVTIVGAGTTTITATQASASYYNSGTISASFLVNKATTVLSNFSIPTKKYSDVPFTITPPTTNSNGAFTYTSSNTAVATVAGDTITIIGVGTSTITATQATSTNYLSATTTATLTVSKGNPVLSNFSIPSKNVGNPPFTITPPTSNSSGAITYTSSNTALATISGTTITILNYGTVTITASQAATTLFNAGTITATLVINNFPPTITNFSVPSKIFGDVPFTLVAPTSNSTGAFTYSSSNISVATVSGTTVTIVGAGTATITATQASTDSYTSGTITAQLVVNQITTALSNFSVPSKTYENVPFSLIAPSTNGNGTFSYSSSDTSVATVSGSTVTIVGAGTATITATQASTQNYTSATISAPLVVGQATLVLSGFSLSEKSYGVAPYTITPPTTPSIGAFTYTSSNSAVATIEGNIITIVGVGSSTITATQANSVNYTSATITTSLVVIKANPIISDFVVPEKTVGNPTFILTTPTTNSDGIFTYTSSNPLIATISGNRVRIIGPGTAIITATQSSTANFNSGTITASFLVNSVNTLLSIYEIPVKTFGDIPFKVQSSSNSSGAISYSSSDTSVATIAGDIVTIVGAGTATITASQEATSAYVAVTASTTLQVNQITTMLGNFSVPLKLFGNEPFSVTAPTTNSNGTFSYSSSDTSVATVSGSTITIVGAGTATITATQASTQNYSSATMNAMLQVNQAPPILSNFTIPAKIFGDAPFTLVAPTSNSNGLISYTSSNATIANIVGNLVTIYETGTVTITAIQASTTNFLSGLITASLVISKAQATLGTFTVPPKNFGNPAFKLIPPSSNSLTPFSYTSSNTDVATINRDIVTLIGVGTTTITATQPTGTNYLSATTSADLLVSLGAPTITGFSVPTKTVVDEPFTLVAPTSNSDGAFTYSLSDNDEAILNGNVLTITGNAGSTTVTATQASTATFGSGTITATFQVNKLTTIMSNFSVATKTFGDAPFTLVAPTTNSNGTITYTSSDTSVATIAGSTITIVGAGTTTITATQSTTSTYSSATISAPFVVNKQTTILSNFLPLTKILGDSAFSLIPPTTNSNGTITYTSSDPAVATIEGNTVTIVGLGTTSITAEQASNQNYTSRLIKASLQVTLLNTVLSDFTIPTKYISDISFGLTPPTSNRNDPFTYTSSNTLVATIAGNVVNIVGVGTAMITAFQASTFNSTPASITSPLVITKITPVLTNFSIPQKNLGNPSFKITPPTSTGPATFSYTSSNPEVATISRDVITIIGVGTTTITATQASSANFISASITSDFTVSLGTPVITGFTIPTKIIGDEPITLVTPTSTSDGAFSYTSSNTDVATIDGNVITIIGAGTSTITATQESTPSYNSGTITATLTVNRIPTVLSEFSVPAKTFGDATFALSNPTSNSSGSFTYTSSNHEVATVDGSIITIVGDGTTNISATQTMTSTHTTATIVAPLVVTPITTIMSDFAIEARVFGESSFIIDPPTTNSSGIITYSVANPAVATVAGNIITMVGLGNTTITATQARTNGYTSASISTLFQVKKIRTVLTNFSISTKTIEDASFAIVMPTTNSSEGAFSYKSSNPLVATVLGDIITIVGVGNTTITAFQESTFNSTSAIITTQFVVGRATPILSNFSLPEKQIGNTSFKIVKPTSNSPANFTYSSSNTDVATISRDTITIVGIGTSIITATQASSANFMSGTITATFVVNKGVSIITNFTIPTKTFGNESFTLVDPSSNSTGSITYSSSSPEVATINGKIVTIVGAGTATITASQEETPFYVSGTTSSQLIVNKANTILSGFSVASKALGNAPFTIVPPITNSDGVFSYTSSKLTVGTIEGDVLTVVGGGVSTITATQASSQNFLEASITAQFSVSSLTTTLSNFNIPTKAVGNAPFALVPPTTNGDGTFTYTSSNTSIATISENIVTIVGAGTTNIIATQSSTENYTSASITAMLVVNKGLPIITNFTMPIKEIGMMDFRIIDPSSTSVGAFTYTSSNIKTATIFGNIVSIKAIGNTIITASQAMTANYIAGTVTANFIVNQVSPTITGFSIPANKNIGDTTVKIVAPKSNSISKFVFTSSDQLIVKITKDVLSFVGAGTATITGIQPATKTFGPGTVSGTITVSPKTTVLINFSVFKKVIGTAPFAIVAPTTNSNGAFTYTSSDPTVATIVGNMITVVGIGSTTITAFQASTATMTSASTSTIFNVVLPTPQVGELIITNKSLSTPTFTLVDPTKPVDNTGTWTYTSSDTTIATVDGNDVTLLQSGIVTITGILSSDSAYNSAFVMTQFSISPDGVVPSTFVFLKSNTVVTSVPASVSPISNMVTLPLTLSTPANLLSFNPKLGTLVEKNKNRNTIINTLFNMFSASTISIPSNLIFLPASINITKMKTVKLVKPVGTTMNSPLVLNTVSADSAVAFVCLMVDYENSVQINGNGTNAGYFIKITKGLYEKYAVVRTNKMGVSVTSLAIAGDVISFGGITVVITTV